MKYLDFSLSFSMKFDLNNSVIFCFFSTFKKYSSNKSDFDESKSINKLRQLFSKIFFIFVFFSFFISIFVLGEPLFFTDLLGATLIVGFQFYNISYPPGRINIPHQNENNKQQFLNEMERENQDEKRWI